jgi:hypothetical protein
MPPERSMFLAKTVLNRAGTFTSTSWHRSAALLARQALEAAIDRFWRANGLAPMVDAPRKRQLICLPWYLDDQTTAHHVHHTWAALSNACHHHAYDLAPTLDELRGWLTDVERAIHALARPAPRPTHDRT